MLPSIYREKSKIQERKDVSTSPFSSDRVFFPSIRKMSDVPVVQERRYIRSEDSSRSHKQHREQSNNANRYISQSVNNANVSYSVNYLLAFLLDEVVEQMVHETCVGVASRYKSERKKRLHSVTVTIYKDVEKEVLKELCPVVVRECLDEVIYEFLKPQISMIPVVTMDAVSRIVNDIMDEFFNENGKVLCETAVKEAINEIVDEYFLNQEYLEKKQREQKDQKSAVERFLTGGVDLSRRSSISSMVTPRISFLSVANTQLQTPAIVVEEEQEEEDEQQNTIIEDDIDDAEGTESIVNAVNSSFKSNISNLKQGEDSFRSSLKSSGRKNSGLQSPRDVNNQSSNSINLLDASGEEEDITIVETPLGNEDTIATPKSSRISDRPLNEPDTARSNSSFKVSNDIVTTDAVSDKNDVPPSAELIIEEPISPKKPKTYRPYWRRALRMITMERGLLDNAIKKRIEAEQAKPTVQKKIGEGLSIMVFK